MMSPSMNPAMAPDSWKEGMLERSVTRGKTARSRRCLFRVRPPSYADMARIGHAGSMATISPYHTFGAGLTELEVRRFQTILREDCGVDLPLPEAWSRAIELLSLVETVLQSRGVIVDRSA